MEVVLLKRFRKLGYANDIVKVADGYGRNYLIPNKIAVYATEGAKKTAKENIKQGQKKLEKERDEYIKLAEKLKGENVVIPAKVNSSNKLFAKITPSVIEKKIVEVLGGKEISGVIIQNKILGLGTAHVKVKLYKDVVVDIDVEVQKA